MQVAIAKDNKIVYTEEKGGIHAKHSDRAANGGGGNVESSQERDLP